MINVKTIILTLNFPAARVLHNQASNQLGQHSGMCELCELCELCGLMWADVG